MSAALQGSVGLNGNNARGDTIAVQSLLTRAGMKLGLVDGRCGPKTISAIVNYQRRLMRNPDGLVEPNATTWRHLTGQGASAPRPSGGAATPTRAVTPVRTPPRVAAANGGGGGGGAPAIVGRATPPVAAAPTPGNSSTSYTTLVPRPDRTTLNRGLTSPANRVLLAKFGAPRENYSQVDQPITNAKLAAMMSTESVGPFRVTGLRPAVASLREVMLDVQRSIPDLYSSLSSAGMKVVRNVRGSSTSISNHSWGTAIDLKINGKLDVRGDNKVYHGLVLLAPFFNARGWYWGAGFRTEDAMHFECGAALIASFPNP